MTYQSGACMEFVQSNTSFTSWVSFWCHLFWSVNFMPSVLLLFYWNKYSIDFSLDIFLCLQWNTESLREVQLTLELQGSIYMQVCSIVNIAPLHEPHGGLQLRVWTLGQGGTLYVEGQLLVMLGCLSASGLHQVPASGTPEPHSKGQLQMDRLVYPVIH